MHQRRAAQQRIIDRVFLARSLVLATVVIAAALAVHRFQLVRLSHELLVEAERSRLSRNFARESRVLHQFLQLHPNRPDVLGLLAQATGRAAQSPAELSASVQWHYRALGHLPDRVDLRTQLAELLLRLGDFQEAADEADTCLAMHPDDPAALRIDGLARYGQARHLNSDAKWQESLDALQHVAERAEHDHEIVAALVACYDYFGSRIPEGAERSMAAFDRLVEAARDGRSYVMRARYRLQHGLAGVAADLQAAAETDPGDQGVRLALALSAHRIGDYSVAANAYRKFAEEMPADPRGYLGLGECQRLQGQIDSAETTWSDGVRNSHQHPSLILRLAESKLDGGQVPEAKNLLQQSSQVIDDLPVTAENRADRNRWRNISRLLQGRVSMAEGQWAAAESMIQLVAQSNLDALGDDVAALQRPRSALLALAEIYRRTGRVTDAEETFARLARLSPSDATRAYLSAGLTLAEEGNYSRANTICERAMSMPVAPADGWLLLASLELEQLAQTLPADRDWRTFESRLARYREAEPHAWRGVLLRAQAQVVQDGGDATQAIAILRHHESSWAHDAEAWSRVAMFTTRLHESAAAEQAAQRYSTLVSDPVDVNLFRARLALQQSDTDTAQRYLDAIPADDPSMNEPQRAVEPWNSVQRPTYYELQQALAAQRSNGTEQRRWLQRLVEIQPDRPEHLRRLVTHAWEHGDDWTDLFSELRTREGESSPFVLLMQARQAHDPSAEDDPAAELLARLQHDAPHWPERHATWGERAVAGGNPIEAANAFLRAAEAGPARTYYQLRAIRCLLDDATWPAAVALASAIDWHGDRGVVSTQLELTLPPTEQVRRLIAFEQRQMARTTDAAVPETDAVADAWLLWLHALADVKGPAWVTPEGSAESRLSFRTLAAPFALRTPEMWAAEQHLQATASADAWTQQLAGTEQGSATHWAIELRLAAHEIPQPSAARGPLFTSLLRHPDSQRAALLIAARFSDMRRNGVLQTPYANVAAAPRLNAQETTVLAADRVAEHRFQSADALEQAGDINGARQEYEDVLLHDATLRNRAAYARFLIRHADWDLAREQWQAMQELQPTAWETVWTGVRCLAQQGDLRAAEAEAHAAAERAQDPNRDVLDQAQQLLQVAELFTDIESHDAARGIYRQLVHLVPYQISGIAASLAEQDRWLDATNLCIAGLDTDLDYIATTTLARLAEMTMPVDLRDRLVLPSIEKRLTVYGDRPEFLFHISNIRLRQQQPREAITLLRRVCELDPSHVIAWNNLAVLLAESPQTRDEAAQCIERALSITRSPLMTLSDTQALVYLHQGDLDSSLELLDRVTASLEGDDPRYFFHLAWVHHLMGNEPAARDALQQAQDLGLAKRFLTQAEHEMFTRLHDASTRFKSADILRRNDLQSVTID